MKTKKIKLEELTCPSCIRQIEGFLSKKQGIDQVKVLFNAGKVKVRYDEETIGLDEIMSHIEKLGFKVLDTALK